MKKLETCRGCRRLTRHLDKLRSLHPDWHNAPVPAMGAPHANLLVLGLAPGRMGANRTGLPFVGDRSADWLLARLKETGCMNADGQLCDTRISNAVKCLPPQNRPKTDEIKRCVHRWLVHELDHPSVILALGKIAHEAVLRAHGLPLQGHHFAHGAVHNIGDTTLVDSFHPSPLNTQTGRLSVEDFNRVLLNARSLTEIKH